MAYVNYNEKSGGPHELVLLDSNTTAEDADIFNRAPDLVIVHTPLVDTFRARVAAGAAPARVDAGVAAGAAPARVAAGAAPTSDVFYSRRNAAQVAYNTRPAAPEHIGMVNDLLGQEADAHADTNLPNSLDAEN